MQDTIPTEASPLVLRCEAMGTTFELVLVAERRNRGRLESIGEAVFDAIREVESRWSLFLPGSRLALLNRTGHQGPLALDADDLALFQIASRVKRDSGGAFEPDVARAMDAAGHFAARGLSAYLPAIPEGTNAVSPGPALDGTWTLDEPGCSVRFTGLGPALDLGAIAKGHALDLAARELREYGVEAALLHGGTSSVVAIGAAPGREAWMVDVHGRQVRLRDQALAISHAGSQSAQNGTHILIPGSKCISADARNSAAVLAPSAALADAWATALCANPELAQTAAELFLQQSITLLP